MKRVLVPVALCALVLLPAVAQQQSPAAALGEQMQKGRALAQAGKCEEAIAEYKRAAEMAPMSASPWHAMSGCYQKIGDHDKALEAGRHALQLATTPESQMQAHVAIGIALVSQGDQKKDSGKYPEAEQEFRAAISLVPRFPVGHFYLGDVLMKQGRDTEGISELRQYLAEYPAGRPLDERAQAAQRYIDTRADHSSPEGMLEDQLYKASVLFRSGKYDDAIKEYKRAAKIKPDDPQAYWGLAQAYQKVGAHRQTVEEARRVVALTSDKVMQANAHNVAGVALTAMAEDNRDAMKFREAEQEFQAALALSPDSAIVHYNLGTLLLKEGRDTDGSAELKRCLECGPSENTAKSAQQFLENPRRARENFAPPFAFTTLQGEYITLEDLQGKVVVLDFWATWCAPCRQSVGDLQHLYKKFGSEGVVLLSISADSDEQALRQFIVAKKMGWPQYWDRDRKIARLFRVNAYPTYLVLDREGIIHKVVVGGDGFQSSIVEDEIKKALKMPVPKSKDANAGT